MTILYQDIPPVKYFVAAFVGSYDGAGAAASINVGNYYEASVPMPTNIDESLIKQSDNVPVMETVEINGTIFYLVFNEEQLRTIGTGECGDYWTIWRCQR